MKNSLVDIYHIPPTIMAVMRAGAAIAISISGGKDSQAMLNYIVHLYKHFGWKGTLFAIFADLGEIEWQGTLEHCYRICQEAGIPLVVVQRSEGGLIERWWERWESIQASDKTAPPFSSASARFCTDHLKVQPIDKFLRTLKPLDEIEKVGDRPPFSSSAARFCTRELKAAQCDKHLRSLASNLVVCCVGIRAEESTSRATKPLYSVRSNITTALLKQPSECKSAESCEAWTDQAWELWQSGQVKTRPSSMPRLALTWHPIHTWKIEQVWEWCGTSLEELEWRRELYDCGLYWQAFAGWQGSWVYVTRNSRLSCSQCVLGSRFDTINGAKLNPKTWRKIVEIEQTTGYSFRNDLALTSLAAMVESFPVEQFDAIYGALRSLGLIYLDEHWRLNGSELTELVNLNLEPQSLAAEFTRRVTGKTALSK